MDVYAARLHACRIVTVHFIGAGPGAPDLITVRGLALIRRCPVCLYAGSLVPREVVAAAQDGARVIDTAPLTLDAIIAEITAAHAAGKDVARVHSGDPSFYGAIAEQMRRLDAEDIPYDIVPGVPAFAAAAAALKRELTLPGVSQTVILTRTAVRASAMPEGEDLATLGASGATLVVHLSINNLARRRARTHAVVSCRLSGGDRLSCRLARRDDYRRHARRHSCQGKVASHHAHGADPGRACARVRRLRRQPALRRRLSSRAKAGRVRIDGALVD